MNFWHVLVFLLFLKGIKIANKPLFVNDQLTEGYFAKTKGFLLSYFNGFIDKISAKDQSYRCWLRNSFCWNLKIIKFEIVWTFWTLKLYDQILGLLEFFWFQSWKIVFGLVWVQFSLVKCLLFCKQTN